MKNMAFGKRVKELREQKGWTKTRLGQACHVSPTCVWNWESTGSVAQVPAMNCLEQVFGVTREYLLHGTPRISAEPETTTEVLNEAKRKLGKILHIPADQIVLTLSHAA